jgi:methyl-accepting chemotaxis protein
MQNNSSILSSVKRGSLSFKIYLIVFLAMLGVCGLLVVSLNNSHTDLLNTKKAELKHLVSTAKSIAVSFQKRELSGEFTREEAQKRAK